MILLLMSAVRSWPKAVGSLVMVQMVLLMMVVEWATRIFISLHWSNKIRYDFFASSSSHDMS